MQRIEEHYNKLKNQLQSLQNAKKNLAKSQPYEAKDFLKQSILPKHQQEKHAKRESLLDDEDLKLVTCTWLRFILPKDHSPLALKKELETNIFPKLLGVYFDRYKHEDVREYHKEWVMRMMNYQKKIEQYDGNKMENVIPPEQLEIWDMRHVLVTHDEIEDKESIIKKKGQGLAIMVSVFLCACYSPLHLTEADAIRLGLDREAQVIIKPGQQADSYWKKLQTRQQPFIIGFNNNNADEKNSEQFFPHASFCLPDVSFSDVHKQVNYRKTYVTINRLSKKAIQTRIDAGSNAIQELENFMNGFITKYTPKKKKPRFIKRTRGNMNMKMRLVQVIVLVMKKVLLQLKTQLFARKEALQEKSDLKDSMNSKAKIKKTKEHSEIPKGRKPTQCQQCQNTGHNRAGCEAWHQQQ
ncbi:19435_t:CDS:2, partial [Racocetra persica]